MHDIAFIAANEWAKEHACHSFDAAKFGADVARAYLSAQSVVRHTGDERATAAALAALSVPVETLQALEQLCALLPRLQAGTSQADLPGTSGAAL